MTPLDGQHPDRQDPEDLLGAYVLGAVGRDEAEAMAATLEADPTTAAEARRLEAAWAEVLTDDALAVTLGADLFDRILATAKAETGPGAPVAPVAPVVDLSSRRDRGSTRRTVTAVLLAAAAIVIVALAGSAVVRSRSVRSQAEVAAVEPGAVAGTLTGSVPGSLRIVVRADRTAYVMVDGLAPAPAGREYQLWSTDGPTPASLGVMGDGSADASMVIPATARSVAVSIEPVGGSTAPTTTPILSGQLT